MKYERFIFAATLAALPFLGSVAQATTVETGAVSNASINGVTIGSDSSGVNVNAPSSASASGAGILGLGVQLPNGESQIWIEGGAADGQPAHTNFVIAQQRITETNTSGAAQSYSLDFALTGISAFLNGDFGGASFDGNPFDTDPPSGQSVGARFEYSVEAQGTEIFSAGLDMFGGNGLYSFANENNVSFTSAGQNCTPFCTGYLYEIHDVIGSLDIGTFADGAIFEIFTDLRAYSYLNGFENEIDFRLGDPTGLNTGVLSVVGTPPQPSAVPLPAAG